METTSESEAHLRVENCWIFLTLTSRKIHPACQAQQWLRNDERHTPESRQQLWRTDNRGLFALDFPSGPSPLRRRLSKLTRRSVPPHVLESTHILHNTLTVWRGKKPNPKEKPHGRTHTTDSNTSPASIMDTTELLRRAICTYHRVVRSSQGIVLAISGSATRLVRRILCQLVAKAGHHLASST